MHDRQRFIVSGRVQGVGFRAATRDRAQALGLSGWVRNLADGRVETQAQGPADALDTFRDWLHSGPDAARVERIEHAEPNDETPTSFEVR